MLSGTIPLGGLVLVTYHLYFAGPDQNQPLAHQSHSLQDAFHSWRCDLSQATQSLWRALLEFSGKKTLSWVLVMQAPVSLNPLKEWWSTGRREKLKKGRRTAENKGNARWRIERKRTQRWRIFLQQHIFEINCFSLRMVFEPPNYSELWNGRELPIFNSWISLNDYIQSCYVGKSFKIKTEKWSTGGNEKYLR